MDIENTMKVSEQIAIMKAYENGKIIERKPFDTQWWIPINYKDNYPFDFIRNEYRIKSESKYRPDKNIMEVLNEALVIITLVV